MVFPPQPSNSLILLSCPCPDGHFPIFSSIRTHPSRGFYLAVDVLGRRRSGSSSWIADRAQVIEIGGREAVAAGLGIGAVFESEFGRDRRLRRPVRVVRAFFDLLQTMAPGA